MEDHEEQSAKILAGERKYSEILRREERILTWSFNVF